MSKKKAKNNVITWEEKKQIEINNFMRYIYFIPEPTYQHKIGDRLVYGYLKDVYITDILENGKLYEIDYTQIDNNYGNPIIHKHQKRIITWLDARKHREPDIITLEKNKNLNLYYSNRDINDLFMKAYKWGVDFEPEYQREYVWDIEDKVLLIDSIFNNIDIGKFVFINIDNKSNKFSYEVLDGKQRMDAILGFYEDRFPYQGKYFSDLSRKDKRHFKNYSISIAEIKDITKEQILRYFLMVNTTGKVMRKEHLDKVREN